MAKLDMAERVTALERRFVDDPPRFTVPQYLPGYVEGFSIKFDRLAPMVCEAMGAKSADIKDRVCSLECAVGAVSPSDESAEERSAEFVGMLEARLTARVARCWRAAGLFPGLARARLGPRRDEVRLHRSGTRSPRQSSRASSAMLISWSSVAPGALYRSCGSVPVAHRPLETRDMVTHRFCPASRL